MIRALAVWLVCTAAGTALVVLLPDAMLGDWRLFSLSERHGPTAADAIGLVIALAGWLVYIRAIGRRREIFTGPLSAGLALTALLATAGSIAAAAVDSDGWLALLVGVTVAAQIVLGWVARRADEHVFAGVDRRRRC